MKTGLVYRALLIVLVGVLALIAGSGTAFMILQNWRLR